MDVFLQLYYFFIFFYLFTSFNPYFNGCLSSTKMLFFQCPYNFTVSILILMDVFLQPKTNQVNQYEEECFNPYFNGCLSSTV